MVWLYDSVFEAGSFRGALARRGGYYAGLLASWGALAWLNIEGPRFRSAGLSAGVTPWMYLVNQGPIITTYLARTVWPHPLVADYGRTTAMPFASAAPYLLLVAGLAVVTLGAWRWNRRVAFLGTWFFVTLAPASSIVPIATEVGAERRMYLPLAALVVLAALAVDAASRRIAPLRAGMTAVVVTVIACTVLAGVSVARNADYHDRLRLWQTVLDARPHGRAHYNMAVELAARGRSDEAIDHYRQATADAPEGHYALGFMYTQRGRLAEAAAELRQFLARLPGDALAPKASNLLGLTLMQQGDAEGAATAFRTTLSMQPRDGDALGGLADALRASGRWAEAETAYRAYLQVNPANAAGVGNLGIVLSALGRDVEAADAFGRAVALAPQSASAHVNYALSLAAVSRREEAVAQLRIALQLDPGNAQARGALEELGR
jgi:tetratricopeptide (TPR) repeat protein